MSKEDKAIYDREYYKRKDVKLKKVARGKALLRLSHEFPKYFKAVYKEELKKQEKEK